MKNFLLTFLALVSAAPALAQPAGNDAQSAVLAPVHALFAAFEAGDAEAAERIRRSAVLNQITRFSEIFKNGGEG